MELPWPALKYVLLIGLIAALLYVRMLMSQRRTRQPHGRDRWRADFRQRRRDRLAATTTWNERRRVQQEMEGGRRIRFEFVPGGAAGESSPESPRSESSERRAKPEQSASGPESGGGASR